MGDNSRSGRVAQWIEHQPSKLRVAGSSPAALTTPFFCIIDFHSAGSDQAQFLKSNPTNSTFKQIADGYTPDAPIGSGPFQIKEFHSDQFMRFEAFKDYWGGAPKVDGIEVLRRPHKMGLGSAYLFSIYFTGVPPTDFREGLRLGYGNFQLVYSLLKAMLFGGATCVT